MNLWKTDERSIGFLFMEDPPSSVPAILISYLLIIKFGPKIMANKKPLELESFMTIYNISQIILNGLLVIMVKNFQFDIKHLDSIFDQASKYIINKKTFFECKGIDVTDNSYWRLSYFYFCLKLLDVFDTVSRLLPSEMRCFKHNVQETSDIRLMILFVMNMCHNQSVEEFFNHLQQTSNDLLKCQLFFLSRSS